MKKRYLLPLLLLMTMTPAMAGAQELTQLFGAAKEGLTTGLTRGAAMAYAGMAQELTLALEAQDVRIEEGKTLRLTITAGNPRPQETKVTFSLKLPPRLAAAPDTMWEAVLPPAQVNEENGTLEPSVSSFTREIALMPGGGSESVTLETEMCMGTRFYRASTPLELCVPDVTVTSNVLNVSNGKLQPGNTFAYEVKVINKGTAPKDVKVEMALPQDVSLAGALPAGFSLEKEMIAGYVRAEAAKQDESGMTASEAVISFPVQVAEDALQNDEDAMRLMTGALRADGKRVPLPRVQVCGARISAELVSESQSLQAGETAKLCMVVVNSGLAAADVQLSCVLPQGLRLAGGEAENEATPAEAGAALPPDDGPQGDGAVVAADETMSLAMTHEDRTLVFNLKMDAAKETKSGVSASTKVIELDVVADTAMENMDEQLVGAALAWRVDEGDTQLGEPVALRVYKPNFMGISKDDWNGIFWASLLLMVTIGLLYAAVRSEDREEDFCCE